MVLIFHALVSDQPKWLITIQSGLFLLALVIVWGLFYGHHIYIFIAHPEKRDEVQVTAEPSSTRQSGQLARPSSFVASGSSSPPSSGKVTPALSTICERKEESKDHTHESRELTATASGDTMATDSVMQKPTSEDLPRITAFIPDTLGFDPVNNTVEMPEMAGELGDLTPANSLAAASTLETGAVQSKHQVTDSAVSAVDMEVVDDLVGAMEDVSMSD